MMKRKNTYEAIEEMVDGLHESNKRLKRYAY